MPLSYKDRIIRMYVNAKAELVTLALGLRPLARGINDFSSSLSSFGHIQRFREVYWVYKKR